MLERPTLLTRLAVAKLAGFLIGLAGFVLIPLLMTDVDPMFRWGVLFWYPTMGVVIALFEQADTGMLGRPLPWWIRGALVGGWFNFVVTFLSWGAMSRFMLDVFGEGGTLTSPFWFVPEGMAAGVLIAYLVMRFGGDGREIADD